MPTAKPKILLIVDYALLERIENYRRSRPVIPSRNEAIRQLLDEALSRFENSEKE